MTLAAENIALKAEVARLREALAVYADPESWSDNECNPAYPDYMDLWVYTKLPGFEIADRTLHKPAPITPETDKAQAVIDAACEYIYAHDRIASTKTLDRLIDAVEAYRGA